MYMYVNILSHRQTLTCLSLSTNVNIHYCSNVHEQTYVELKQVKQGAVQLHVISKHFKFLCSESSQTCGHKAIHSYTQRDRTVCTHCSKRPRYHRLHVCQWKTFTLCILQCIPVTRITLKVSITIKGHKQFWSLQVYMYMYCSLHMCMYMQYYMK